MFGPLGAVKGRLPHGWRIESSFDDATGVLYIVSPDTDRFRIVVDTNKMDEYSADHKRTLDQLDQDATVEAKYDDMNEVRRFDSSEIPEFWLEVHLQNINKPSKKLKTSSDQEEKVDKSDEKPNDEDRDDFHDIMPWSKMQVDDGFLTLWPGISVRKQDMYGPEGLPTFFKKKFDIEVTPVGCVETLPYVDEFGDKIEDTGGRHDFFFFVKAADVPKFALKRFSYGMRWWSDVYFNNGEGIYPQEFLKAYPEHEA